MPRETNKVSVLIREEFLRKLIKRMDFALQDFSKLCKLTPSSLSLFLSNKRETTPQIRRCILKRLRKTYSEIEWDDIFSFADESIDE